MSKLLRILKISLAVVLLVLSLWALLLPPYFPSSSHMIVNTRKIPVNARTDGVLAETLVEPRGEVAKGAPIARIVHDQTELRREIEQLGFLKKRLEMQIANTKVDLTRSKDELAKTQMDYAERKSKTIRSLEGTLEGLNDKAAIEQRQLDVFREDEKRILNLLEKGIVTRARWSELSKLKLDAEAHLQSTQSDQMRVADELDLAKEGLHLANSEGNDALTAEITSLQQAIRNSETQKTDLELQLKETNALIETSLAYRESSKDMIIRSPADGMVWTSQCVEGQSVSIGQPLVQLADRRSIFIESFFHRYYQGSIFPGNYAHVQLRGESRLLVGKVLEVSAQEHGSDDIYVINSVAPNSSMLRVVIELKEGDLSVYQIGRLGKVVVTDDRPDAVNRSLVWLTLMLRNQTSP